MAVHLDATSGHRVGWGTPNWGGATGLAVAITFTPDGSPASRRICGQWNGGNMWLMQLVGSDEIGFVVQQAGGALYGFQTDALNMVAGTTYRIIGRVTQLTGTKTRTIWVNGSSIAGSPWIGAGNTSALMSSTTDDLRIGDVDGNVSEPGNFAEFALWDTDLPDADCEAYGKAVSPLKSTVRPSFYSRLLNTTDINDLMRSRAGTNSSGTSAAHPRVIYPRRRQAFSVAAAAGGFSSAFFRENAGLGAAGGGPFARANAGLGAIA